MRIRDWSSDVCSSDLLIYGGVLERFPTLRVVFTETGSAWVADKLASMDWFYEIPYKLDRLTKVVPRRPSEYFHRQCAIGSSILSRQGVDRREECGVGDQMIGPDLPHLGGPTGSAPPFPPPTPGGTGG